MSDRQGEAVAVRGSAEGSAPSMGASEIVVATSIPPSLVRNSSGRDVGRAYQQYCIQSWADAGLKVVSLNFPEEIPDLVRQYPDVTFVALDRRECATFGHKTPLLTELLHFLARQDEEIVGIMNADIFLEPDDWVGAIRDAVKGAILVAHRYNVDVSSHRDPAMHVKGFDLFFLERREIPELPHSLFAMGMPWWDYCLPLAFELKGLKVNLLTRPHAFHLQHPNNFKMSTWRRMAKEFAEFVLDFVAAKPDMAGGNLAPIITLCQEVASDFDNFEDARPSALAKAWEKIPGPIGQLPDFSHYVADRIGRDAVRHRLSKACALTISNSMAASTVTNSRTTPCPVMPFMQMGS
jgi:hypothetical protein